MAKMKKVNYLQSYSHALALLRENVKVLTRLTWRNKACEMCEFAWRREIPCMPLKVWMIILYLLKNNRYCVYI